jgi:hypothetical protein
MRLWSWLVGVLMRVSLEVRRQGLKLEDLLLERLNQRVIADLFLNQLFVHNLVDRVQALV